MWEGGYRTEGDGRDPSQTCHHHYMKQRYPHGNIIKLLHKSYLNNVVDKIEVFCSGQCAELNFHSEQDG